MLHTLHHAPYSTPCSIPLRTHTWAYRVDTLKTAHCPIISNAQVRRQGRTPAISTPDVTQPGALHPNDALRNAFFFERCQHEVPACNTCAEPSAEVGTVHMPCHCPQAWEGTPLIVHCDVTVKLVHEFP